MLPLQQNSNSIKMFGQIPLNILLLFMLYGAGTMTAVIACIYLLCKDNAFAPNVISPVHLRWWTAIFFAFFALSHIWYLPTAVLTSRDDIMLCYLIGGLLDLMTIFPLAFIIFIRMLQDQRRPIWPPFVMMAPPVIGTLVCIVTRSETLIPTLRIYLLLMGICITIYMIHAVRQYGSWLRDNHAELEHKEMWQSYLVLADIMLMVAFYSCGFSGLVYEYIIQVWGIVLLCHLLWRVETLSDLSISKPIATEEETVATEGIESDDEHQASSAISTDIRDDIKILLQQHCVDTQLYLQHGLTVTQLTQAIGTNRFYLGQYFSQQGTTYNAYINDLRINHFVNLYREYLAAHRLISAKQLASESGYRSYSTFSLAFKQRMGQSLTAWISETEQQ